MLTIFSPHLSDEDLSGTIEQVTGYVTGGGGAVTQAIRDSPWGRRRLAYTIRHNGQDLRDGFYVLFYFDAEPRRIADLERALQLNDRVVRHMVVKVDERQVARQAAIEAKRATRPVGAESR
jgi:small subunit ribosomal protein S6